MKCFKRAKDNVATSTIIIKNEVEMDQKEEKDKISVETAHDLVNKSLELLVVVLSKECQTIQDHCIADDN